MQHLLKRCHEAYRDIAVYRDHPDAFDPESDYDFVEYVLTKLQDEARNLGCVIPALSEGFNIGDALNIIAEIIRWCEEHHCTSDVMTVRQAAEYLNVSDKTIYALCEDGALAHCRIGKGRGAIRITRANLDDFMRQNQIRLPKDYLSD